MLLRQSRHVDPWNGIEDSEISPYTYNNMIFDKGAKSYVGEKIASSTNDVEKMIATYRRMKLDPSLSLCIKLIQHRSKILIQDLSI
jgi:hypothetical protein